MGVNDLLIGKYTKAGNLLSSIFARITSVMKKNDGPIWFRGQAAIWKLGPSLYRQELPDPFAPSDELFDRLFQRLKNSFIQDCSRHIKVKPENELEWQLLMQHFELPTRFLDWTKDPLTALYYAVKGTLKENRKDDMALWMIFPKEINKNYVMPFQENFNATWPYFDFNFSRDDNGSDTFINEVAGFLFLRFNRNLTKKSFTLLEQKLCQKYDPLDMRESLYALIKQHALPEPTTSIADYYKGLFNNIIEILGAPYGFARSFPEQNEENKALGKLSKEISGIRGIISTMIENKWWVDAIITGGGHIFNIYDLKGFISKGFIEDKNNIAMMFFHLLPVCVQTAILDERMSAQQGVFTYHQCFKEQDDYFTDNNIYKLTIPHKFIGALEKALQQLSISEARLFPTVDNIAKEIKDREVKFWRLQP